MIKHKRHELEPTPIINVTNMIDVMLTLLLFFMLTSGMTRPHQVELDLPDSTSAAQAQAQPPLVVSYTVDGGQGKVMVNNKLVSGFDKIGDAMRGVASPDQMPRVDLRIDKVASYQEVITLMDAVRDAGFPKFSMLTLAPSKATPKPR